MTNIRRITDSHQRQRLALSKADQVTIVNSHPISGNQGIYIQPSSVSSLTTKTNFAISYLISG